MLLLLLCAMTVYKIKHTILSYLSIIYPCYARISWAFKEVLLLKKAAKIDCQYFLRVRITYMSSFLHFQTIISEMMIEIYS